jgi:hypothetical protein
MTTSPAALVIDTPKGIAAFHLLAQRGALKLECLGMRHSSGRSVAKLLKDAYGFKGNKHAVLEQFEAHLRKEGVLR